MDYAWEGLTVTGTGIPASTGRVVILSTDRVRIRVTILCYGYGSGSKNAIPADLYIAAMQEKHPSDKWSSKLMDLPCVTHSVPYQASEKEVADAVRSFPAGSASGPDGLRPQNLLDLLNNQESSAAFLSSLTDFINVLLRGECPKEMREIMFGGSLIALSKKIRGSETNSDWVHLQKA